MQQHRGRVKEKMIVERATAEHRSSSSNLFFFIVLLWLSRTQIIPLRIQHDRHRHRRRRHHQSQSAFFVVVRV